MRKQHRIYDVAPLIASAWHPLPFQALRQADCIGRLVRHPSVTGPVPVAGHVPPADLDVPSSQHSLDLSNSLHNQNYA